MKSLPMEPKHFLLCHQMNQVWMDWDIKACMKYLFTKQSLDKFKNAKKKKKTLFPYIYRQQHL